MMMPAYEETYLNDAMCAMERCWTTQSMTAGVTVICFSHSFSHPV